MKKNKHEWKKGTWKKKEKEKSRTKKNQNRLNVLESFKN